MKRIISILIFNLFILSAVVAQSVEGVSVENLQMKRNGEYIAVNMDVDFSALDVSSNRAVLITPMLVNGTDSVDLSSVGFYGRRRYINYVRNGSSILGGTDGVSYRTSEMPDSLAYHTVLPYKKWMNGANLVIRRCEYGCCNKVVDKQFASLGAFKERIFTPQYVYVRPEHEISKTRSLSGSAYIDFVVNKTDIRPTYRRNQVELAKIQGTIDSVKNDKDMTITSISIKGFASPEGSYASNELLAKNRTESLKKYVQNLYHFEDSFIQTSYEPEDWAGLREFVEASQLANKERIIALIDGSREPDNKEWMIKSTYVEDYDYLLANCYPSLRHSDYKVEYVIRSYKDVEEIKKVFAESPQKLSLEEFYILGQVYEPGSREINDVFETAVRMYPNDHFANLNAAISEMQNKDYTSAEPHLKKAGDSPEAIYARGIYAAFMKDYDRALEYLTKAQELGIAEATDAIEQVNDIK